MNRYHIEVIMNDKRYTRAIDAEGISWSDSGLYEFWITNEDGRKRAVAYFPVYRTIIDTIEYDIIEND